jgi:hypothetical protein
MRRRPCCQPTAYILAAILLFAGRASAEELTVIGFNAESGGADPQTLSTQIAAIRGCDLWGFSEVENEAWAEQFEQAAAQGGNADFRGILGATGGSDRLLIVYNYDRFEARRHFELDDINIGGHVRAPLVVELRLKSTGLPFLFMVNHLYLTDPDGRHEQARRLNRWAATQTMPVIAVGDYNFDWNVKEGEKVHDLGYDLLTAKRVFEWIPPRTLIRTKCAVPSILDFTFVAGPARDWNGSSSILFPEEAYCPGDNRTSDHRPVRTTFVFDATPPPPPAAPTVDMLLRRIERLEHQLGLPPER